VSVRLETDRDRRLESTAIQRILEHASPDTRVVAMPPFSAIDYLLIRDWQATTGFEIKTRKESVEQVRSYGGLMLKHRKVVEMANLAEMLQIRTIVAFCFDNANGPILLAEPAKLLNLEPMSPPQRRNYRGLTCDTEPVVYLDWDHHLVRLT